MARFSILSAALIVAISIGGSASGGSATAGGTPLERGRALYRGHCLNCHGAKADGNGPMAELLVVDPTDLTLLQAKNDGEFPSEKVYRAIDGREEIKGHGERRMPIWGLSFQQLDRDTNQEAEVRARIASLVAYLESLQAEARD